MKKLFIFSLFIISLQFTNAQSERNAIGNKLPIAYVNIDTLLLKYQFAKDANESLVKKQEEYRLIINTRARKLQIEMGEFQKKLEKNEFQSRELAEQEQARLQKVQKELQDLDSKFSDQLKQEQNKLSENLREKIKLFLVEYNKDRKYEIIFSNTSGDNILFAVYGYDITNVVVKALNESFNNNPTGFNDQSVDGFWGFKFGDKKDNVIESIREIKGFKNAGYNRISEQISLENIKVYEFTFDSLKMNFYNTEFQKGTLVKIYNIENKENLQKDVDKLIKTLSKTYGDGENVQRRQNKTLFKIWKSSSNDRDLILLTTNNYNTKFGRIVSLRIEFNGTNAHKIIQN